MFIASYLIAKFEYGSCSLPKVITDDMIGVLTQASNQSVVLQRMTQII